VITNVWEDETVGFDFGVDSFIWSENFGRKDLHLFQRARDIGFTSFDVLISHPDGFPVDEVRKAAEDAGIRLVTSCVLNAEANPLNPDPKVRCAAVEFLKRIVDINLGVGSKVTGGVNYAAWGYLTGRPRTDDEWNWSVEALRQVAEYAKSTGDTVLAFEPVNRFETHFLNIAADAVQYCKDIGLDNCGVHLDTFHMIREETSFSEAVKTCGKQYLKDVHVCENNRGIPGTGLVPWREFFTAVKTIEYDGPLTIESFDPDFEEVNRLCAIWRRFAESGEQLATEGLENLKAIAATV
jgi:D-psicose/D-tagatose/L-ribulose 3-epimerase